MRLLDDEVNWFEQQVEKRRHSMVTYGASICLNGWSDVKNHPLINFMIVCPEGEIFEGNVDASEHKKTWEWMAMKTAKIIEKKDQNWWYKFVLTTRVIWNCVDVLSWKNTFNFTTRVVVVMLSTLFWKIWKNNNGWRLWSKQHVTL